MFMGVVDTLMVRHLGPEAIGAVGMGSSVFLAVAVFGMGILLGLDPLISQAYGARDLNECHRWLWHGCLVGGLASIPLTAGTLLLPELVESAGVRPEVLALAGGYLRTLSLSLFPLLLFFAARRYLQSMGVVRPVMAALLLANVVNAVANWLLVNGHLGFPRLGVVGSAWSTTAARVFMLAVLVWAIARHERETGSGLWTSFDGVEWRRVRRLCALGVPAALQMTMEVGVFALATVLAGKLSAVSLASHQIALNMWSLGFMVPLGLASGGSVLVGQAVGARDLARARWAGWAALASGAGFMTLVGFVFLAVPRWLVSLFTPEETVIATGATLLVVCSGFQLFDGVQVIATGALRGLGETRTPMFWNLAGHWCFGLPVGYVLAFRLGWDVVGLWIGLALGLLLVGGVLTAAWHRRTRPLPPTPDTARAAC